MLSFKVPQCSLLEVVLVNFWTLELYMLGLIIQQIDIYYKRRILELVYLQTGIRLIHAMTCKQE